MGKEVSDFRVQGSTKTRKLGKSPLGFKVINYNLFIFQYPSCNLFLVGKQILQFIIYF